MIYVGTKLNEVSFIASRVYAEPLQLTTEAQDASDRDLANRIYSECIQAYN